MPEPERKQLAEVRGYRERLLSAVLWCVVLGLCFACPVLILREKAAPALAATLLLALLSVGTVALVRSIPFSIRLGVVLLCLYVVSAGTLATRGYSPNVFMILGVTVVLGTLLSGRWLGLGLVVVNTSTLLAVSWLQRRGTLIRIAGWQAYSDSTLTESIVRVDAIFVFTMIAFVVAISYVVEQIEELGLQKTRVLADLVARDEALLALNQTLEQRVLERTAQLVKANEALSGEMQARLQMEIELRQAQKLQSVGRLAAGVAHEINTPVQFVSDSVHFLQDSLRDLFALLSKYRALEAAVASGNAALELAQALASERESVELDYLTEHAPRAVERALGGLGRVANIVRSMKEFAQPDQTGIAQVDLNLAINNILTVAKGDIKTVAEVEAKLGKVPLVACHAGEVNQALLNIIVNATHAIEDAVRGTQRRGLIRIETAQDGEAVTIAISDTGPGIPEEIRERIFDPFFTTKEVGRGTGQGLTIARSVIEDRHGGRLAFETVMGQGTTFTVRLPIQGKA